MNHGIIRCEPCNTSYPFTLGMLKSFGIKCGSCGTILLKASKGSKYIATPRSGSKIEANA